MPDELKKALFDYLFNLVGLLSKGTDIAAAQLPAQVQAVIQEKLHYDFMMAIVWITMPLAVIGLACIIRYFGLKASNPSDYHHKESAAVSAMLIAIFGGMVFLFVFFINIADIIQIYVAPRLYIIEWLRTFTAGH